MVERKLKLKKYRGKMIALFNIFVIFFGYLNRSRMVVNYCYKIGLNLAYGLSIKYYIYVGFKIYIKLKDE